MTKINYGFTLAEVLITLGIIGVVAAMTMPSLIANHQEKVTVTKVKKVYSILSQAYLIAVEEYGTPDEWGTTARDAGDENDENYSAGNAVIIREKLFKGLQKISICDKAKIRKPVILQMHIIGLPGVKTTIFQHKQHQQVHLTEQAF